MNTFAEIVPIEELSGGKVRYYSVRVGEEENTLFQKFLNKFEEHPKKKVQQDLNDIVIWLARIGARGAKAGLFRVERAADGLPPPFSVKGARKNSIRLYCLRLNDHVVVLFDGDIKTAEKAQECHKVWPLLDQADKISKAIRACMREKYPSIRFNQEKTDIVFTNPVQF